MMSTSSKLINSVLAFADSIEQIKSLADLSSRVEKIVTPLGYTAIASGLLGNSEAAEALHFATWDPKWLDTYFSKGFVRMDPFPIWAIHSGLPVTADELRALLPKSHPGHAVFTAAKAFGYLGGYIIPQRSVNGGLGLVAFVGARDPQTIRERAALRLLASFVFERAEFLLGRRFSTGLPFPPPALTTRERRTLQLLADGMKAAQIAKMMKISQATVRFHTNNLKRKTTTSNLTQLVSFAIATGLIPRRSTRRSGDLV
jgi:DNA-binding CsgD family transcriptional regulator